LEPAEVSQFAWLLGTTSHRRRKAPSDTELQVALQFVTTCWQIAPVTVPRLEAWAGKHLPADRAQELRDLACSVSVLAKAQSLLCLRYTDALENAGIPYTLLKGSAARLTAYDQPDLRGALDVDVGVPKRFIYRAESVAQDLGFVSALLYDDEGRHFRTVDPTLKAATESNHYELACLVRRQSINDLSPAQQSSIKATMDRMKPWHLLPDGTPACYVTLDVHHGISLDIPVDEVVESAVECRAHGGKAKCPAPYWQLFHLIFKIYWEGVHNYRKGAYQYADVARILPQLAGQDVDRLAQLVQQYGLQAAAFYVLRRVETDLGQRLPPPVATMIREYREAPMNVHPGDVNDLGDMWPKLWGRR
jgi:hypothetical protein